MFRRSSAHDTFKAIESRANRVRRRGLRWLCVLPGLSSPFPWLYGSPAVELGAQSQRWISPTVFQPVHVSCIRVEHCTVEFTPLDVSHRFVRLLCVARFSFASSGMKYRDSAPNPYALEWTAGSLSVCCFVFMLSLISVCPATQLSH